jgi:prepilin-type N-terminal cleavage/methylation domain-containing protein
LEFSGENHFMNAKMTRRQQKGFSLIELMIVVAIIAIIAAIAVPMLNRTLMTGREAAAIQSLKTIHNAQARFNSERGRFGTLKDLVDDEALDKTYASTSAISGYIYTDVNVTANTYCVQATRQTDGTAKRDFNVTEKGIVNYIRAATKNPVPYGEGVPVSQLEMEKAAGK